MGWGISQQALLHNNAVQVNQQHMMLRAQQLGNYVNGQPGLYGRNAVAQQAYDALEQRARGGQPVGAALQSASNAPPAWTRAQPAQAGQAASASSQAVSTEPSCVAALLASCCNLLGCSVDVLE